MAIKTILEAMADRKLFGQWFGTNWRGKDTWRRWRAFLAALFALPMDDDARAASKQFTGRDDLPTEQASEAWIIAGRRSGKSRIAALVAVYLAAFRDYAKVLAPGEVGTVMIIASDKRQARTVLSYVDAFFSEIPILSRMVVSRTKESITLANYIRIEVHTASFRSIRGYTVVAAVLDEIAFFQTGDSANPDDEIVAALRPAMATVPGALLLGISSPYAKRGVLWQMFREHYGKANAPALVWRAATREMNPTVSQVTIAAALGSQVRSQAHNLAWRFNSVARVLARRLKVRNTVMASHTPSAAQVAQLATLRTAAATAQASLTSATANLAAAQAAHQNASRAVVEYQGYIYGGLRPGLDAGPDAA